MKFPHGLRILTVIRILAGLFVLLVVALTATLAYHVHIEPVGGKMSRLIPEPGSMNPHHEAISYARTLEQRELPNIEPGAQAFGKATQLLSAGKMGEAREKLTTIFNIFPNSSVATKARRIVSDMNLDALLGNRNAQGRQIHTVQPGDSYLAIAAKYRTTVPMMIHLNSMKRLKGIQPGDKLLVMPLDFRLIIDQRHQSVSIWDGGRFISEYPALSMRGLPRNSGKVAIKQIIGERFGSKLPSHDENYCSADKVIQLDSGSLQIRAWEGPVVTTEAEENELPHGVLIRAEQMEELALLVRRGNLVEIR